MVPEVSNLTGTPARPRPQRFGDGAEARRSGGAALS